VYSATKPENLEQLAIIKANTTHIPVIRDLTMEVWPQTYTPIIGADQVAYMLGLFYTPEALEQQMSELNHQFIIGYRQGAPVSFASYSAIEPSVFKLHKLYILPATQGSGAGRGMVDHIVQQLPAPCLLRLNVNIHNHQARAFYKRYGFCHLRDEDINIGGGYFMNDHVLQLEVSGK
jgi:ribosomal protein S18 acetylase RimI-like enzyme